MRKIIHDQIQMGEMDISVVTIELDSRDEIPQLLRGLQHLYKNPSLRAAIFKELWKIVPKDIDIDTGRDGMSLWSILVLGILRLSCNWDYDKLQEIANNHMTLRQMLGHGMRDQDKRYPRQTLCDNLRWFTPKVLEAISRIVVNAGHAVVGITDQEKLHGRCDTFVVKTDVHFPTDINLLWDATRKVLQIGGHLGEDYCIEGWRQTPHNLLKTKRLFRKVQRLREKDKTGKECLQTTECYVQTAEEFFDRAERSFLKDERQRDFLFSLRVEEMRYFVQCGRTLSAQIHRRCLLGEKIAHEEKIFSLFEPYTEWISKGKAGVPQELGLRVGIVESQGGFILHHRVMVQETDDQVAVPMITETKKRFPMFSSCSFDKGFHSPENQRKLAKIIDLVILPRKGKLDAQERDRESAPDFVELRRKHSAVESAINALENHSLDVCPDTGLDGFERYVALAVVARNIQLLGRALQLQALEAKERERLRRAA